jgi:hypothetical protein
MHTKFALILAVAVLGACSSDEPPPEKKAPEGRAETRGIRNTEAIGYDGKAIADKVDQGLDANERRIKEQEQASEETPP